MNNTKNEQEIINSIIASLEELTLPGISVLNQKIKEKFGLSGIDLANSSNEKQEKKEDEKTTFSLILNDVGSQRISVFTKLKEITGKSLLEVKGLTDKLPLVIIDSINLQKAEDLKADLISKGADVEIK